MGSMNKVQSSLSWGELDPLLYAQVTFEGYDKGLKSARNCIILPQGGITKRWGTVQFATLAATNPSFVKIYGYVYDNDTVYLLVFQNNSLTIYLENILIATVVTDYTAETVEGLYFVPVQTRLTVLRDTYRPRQLARTANAANIITGVNVDPVNTINITVALTVGNVLPITFTTAGTLPVTTPQIYVNTLYFARVITANSIAVYSTSAEAAADINRYIITAAGAGVSNVIVQNTWNNLVPGPYAPGTVPADIPFSNLPAFDFDAFATYSAAGFTFQVSAVTGTLVAPTTITASGAVFTAAHVGGLFIGGGGIARIIGFTNPTNVTATTYVDFTVAAGAAGAFAGREAFLGEPAWSDARGWPTCGEYHQERYWLAATRSITHGLWGSTLFQPYDFDDSEPLDDNAISDYSSKSTIRALTSTKSLVIHSVRANSSTPLTDTSPLTPRTTLLTDQNEDGVTKVRPVFLDNQIIYIDRKADNVKNMSWDIVQSSYVNTNISIGSAHLVDAPIDMAVFAEPFNTDGQYVFLVNQDGSLAIFQTLIEQQMKAWTPGDTSQGITNGFFRKVASGLNQCWFLIQRLSPIAQAGVAITAFTSNTLTAVNHGLLLNYPNRVNITATVPASVPTIVVGTTYYARGLTKDTFSLYATFDDAERDVNRFTFTSAGAGSTIVKLDTAVLYLESLDYGVQTDSSRKYVLNPPANTVTGLQHLQGLTVQIVGDSFVLQEQVVPASGILVLAQNFSSVQVGLQITATITPLPLNLTLQNGPNIYTTKHIRTLYIHYHNLVTSATIQGLAIPAGTMGSIVLNVPPEPASGVYPYTLMEGWDVFGYDIVISQTQPLGMTILGLGYNTEVF